jgi:hypothetical protein
MQYDDIAANDDLSILFCKGIFLGLLRLDDVDFKFPNRATIRTYMGMHGTYMIST